MNRTRVLLVDNDIEVCRMFSDRIDPFGDIRVDTIYYAEDIACCLSEIYYSIVIADKSMISESDIKSIYKNKPNPERHPIDTEIILTSSEIKDDTVLKLAGFDPIFLLKKPFDFDFVMKLIRQADEIRRLKESALQAADKDPDPSANIDEALKQLGIPSSMKGHAYLHTAVDAVIAEPELIDHVTKLLYPVVARAHHTTAATVERLIRHTIGVTWDRGDVAVLRDYFGNTVSRKRGKPTNSEFIASIAEKIKA